MCKYCKVDPNKLVDNRFWFGPNFGDAVDKGESISLVRDMKTRKRNKWCLDMSIFGDTCLTTIHNCPMCGNKLV